MKNEKSKKATLKIPLLDIYLVRGCELRRLEQSRAIRNKVTARLLAQNMELRKRLAIEIGSKSKKCRMKN